MILYILTDSPENIRRNTGFYAHARTLEELAEDCCVTLAYYQVDADMLARLQPWAICHSGGSAGYDIYDVLQHPAYHAVITEYDVAQIGFCGGHQIIAHAFGSTLGHMHPLGPDEPDLAPGYNPGYFKEWGVFPVRVLTRDPLFDGLGETICVQEYHMDEVKELVPALGLLASTKDCRVQAFRHRERPIYGTQFHPEQANEHYPDGFTLLRNFFRLAREYTSEKQCLAAMPPGT